MVQAIDVITTGALILIMFSIGSSLTRADFKRIIKRPQEIGIGLLLQIVLLPLLAFIITDLWNLPAEAKIGIVILASCPGGSTSNFISYLVGADAALSISMTVINSFITLLSIPFFVGIALNRYMDSATTINLPIGQTILAIIFITIIPAILGVLAREHWENPIKKSQHSIKIASLVLLALMFSIKFFAGESMGGSGLTSEAIWTLIPAVLLLHLLALFIGYFIARLAHFSSKSSTTIGIEVGLQNTTLAILVAGTLIGNETMVQAALVYALFSFFTTTGFGWWMIRQANKKEKEKSSKKSNLK